MYDKLVGELDRRMKELGLDAKTVSVRAGLGASFIRDIQRGKSREPKRSALAKIAEVLGCSVSDLVGEPSPLPSQAEIESALDALEKEADTTAALVGASLLEAALERLLRTRLLTTDDELLREIFAGRGPLADLRSKILIAQAFGLVTTPMASELQSIKEIRDYFAHSRQPLNFDAPQIAERVLSLGMIRTMKAHGRPDLPALSKSTKNLYLLEIKILLIIFDGTTKHGGTADAALGEVLA